MTAAQFTSTHQSVTDTAGLWKLPAGRAYSLRPPQSGFLQVSGGDIWATFDGPHSGPPNDLGDHVIGVGERLELKAGQRVVVESWHTRAPAYVTWNPVS